MKKTTQEKIALFDKFLSEGYRVNEAARMSGLSERRYMMIKQEAREQAALEFLLSHVDQTVKEQYMSMKKSPGRVNWVAKDKLPKAGNAWDNEDLFSTKPVQKTKNEARHTTPGVLTLIKGIE